MATGTLHIIETFTLIRCADCRMSFAVPDEYERDRRRDHKTFYCPRGHHNYYPHKSDVEKAREETEQAREAAERLRRQLDRRGEDLQRERRSHSATKGQLTKTRKRAAHGVCPVESCHRSFANVAAHVARQHPDFLEA